MSSDIATEGSLLVNPHALVVGITQAHEAAQASARAAVAHAVRAGELLIEAKAALPHGEFTAFCKSLPFSDRTARAYMRLGRLSEADRQRVASLPLRDALVAIAGPSRPRVAAPQAVVPWHGLSPAERGEYCRLWFDRQLSETLLMHGCGWPAERIAEWLGVTLSEVTAIVNVDKGPVVVPDLAGIPAPAVGIIPHMVEWMATGPLAIGWWRAVTQAREDLRVAGENQRAMIAAGYLIARDRSDAALPGAAPREGCNDDDWCAACLLAGDIARAALRVTPALPPDYRPAEVFALYRQERRRRVEHEEG